MIRTRDFLLFVLATGFLLVAIAATVAGDQVVEESTPVPVGGGDVAYQASVDDETIDREAKRAQLRAKLAAETSVVTAPLDEGVFVREEDGVDEITLLSDSGAVQLCDQYSELAIVWPSSGIETVEREGARVVYVPEIAVEEQVIGSTTKMVEVVNERVLLQLPMRTQPLPQNTCLPHDVVGVALDGSLIRNNEQGLYGIFGSGTLIGYALDGFPIYGSTSEVPVDECGGAMMGVQYRYYLHPERDGVLNCFSGVPAQLNS